MEVARNWGAIAVRGVAAIVFGLLALALPGLTLAALVLLFGAYALVDGIFSVIAAVRRRAGDPPWWLLLLEGIVGVTAGVVTFVLPALTAATLVYIIAAWAIVTGMLEIVAAVRLRRQLAGEWRLLLSGVLSVVFGVLVMRAPAAGALALVLWIGACAIVFGALLLALAFWLRRAHAESRDAVRPRGIAARDGTRLRTVRRVSRVGMWHEPDRDAFGDRGPRAIVGPLWFACGVDLRAVSCRWSVIRSSVTAT